MTHVLLVEPAVARWVHFVELGQHGPHGFVREVIHQLLHRHEQEVNTLHQPLPRKIKEMNKA